MNNKKERYISSELSDKTQLSVLRSIVGWGYEKIRHSLGRPGQLERAIASGELIPCPLKTPVDTLWTRSVIYWQDWISPSWIPSDSRQCTIHFYKPGYYRGLERCHFCSCPLSGMPSGNFCSAYGQIESLSCKHADGFSFMSAMAPVCYSCR